MRSPVCVCKEPQKSVLGLFRMPFAVHAKETHTQEETACGNPPQFGRKHWRNVNKGPGTAPATSRPAEVSPAGCVGRRIISCRGRGLLEPGVARVFLLDTDGNRSGRILAGAAARMVEVTSPRAGGYASPRLPKAFSESRENLEQRAGRGSP